MDTRLSFRLGRYGRSLDNDHQRRREKPTQHLRHAVLLLRQPANGVQNNKVTSPLLIVRICPSSIDTQGCMPLRPRRHLVGRRLVRFLRFGIHSSESVITIPVRADVGGHNVSRGVETIGDKVPIATIRLDKVLQELVVLWCP